MARKPNYYRLGDGQCSVPIRRRMESPRVRPVLACPGNDICPYGLVNTQTLAEEFDQRIVGRDLPARTRFSVSGCINGCTKPQQHDVGLRAAAELLIDHENCIKCQSCVRRCPALVMSMADGVLSIDHDKCLYCGVCLRACPQGALKIGRFGYHLYIGGKGGRSVENGTCIATFIAEEQVIPYLEAILALYQEMADKGQRLNTVLSKVGIAVIKAKLEKTIKP